MFGHAKRATEAKEGFRDFVLPTQTYLRAVLEAQAKQDLEKYCDEMTVAGFLTSLDI